MTEQCLRLRHRRWIFWTRRANVLLERGTPFDCFEVGSGNGGRWRYNNDNGMSAAYGSLHTHPTGGLATQIPHAGF